MMQAHASRSSIAGLPDRIMSLAFEDCYGQSPKEGVAGHRISAAADPRISHAQPGRSPHYCSRRTCLYALAALACSVAEAASDQPPAPVAAVETIVVQGRKLEVETLLDRKVYNVSSDVQSTFGTLSDILSVIPSVDVDSNGGVTLRGDSNVLILIDGKPSTQFSGAAAGDNLQSIPASNIERIEVLTNPPAQFKAEGVAGVINIITRKKHPEGVAGTLQGSLGSGGRSVIGASVSYSVGPLTASATAGYRQDYRHRITQSDLIAPDPTTGQLIDSTAHIDERIRREVPTVGLSAEYTLNEHQLINASASWADRGGLRTYTQLNSNSDPAGVLLSSSQRLSSGHDPEINREAKLGFTQKLGRPEENLDLSLHRSTSNQSEHYDYTHDSFIPPLPTFYNNLSFQEFHGITEFGADYVLPLAPTRFLKLGYAFELDDYSFSNVGHNVDPLTGVELIDPNLTNDFKVRQLIHSVYGSYQGAVGQWTWLAGLRMELTHIDAQQLSDNISNARRYLAPFPSLHVDRALSETSNLSFGASRRITRPEFEYLNPYVNYEYAPNLNAGNPSLLPQYTQSYEIAYGHQDKSQAYELTGYYRLNKDSVTDVTESLGNGLSLATKANLPKTTSAGIEFSSSGPLFLPQLSYSISGNLFYSQIDATALGISGLRSTTGLNGKLKLDYRPTDEDSAQITVTRTDKRLTPQGYVSAITLVNFGYKHRLKSRLTAIATVSDLFNGQRSQRYANTPTFTQTYMRTVYGQVLYVGLVYAFGSTKKDKQANFEYDQSN